MSAQMDRLRNSFVLNLSPYEYEEYIAEQLRQNPEYGVMFKALTNVKPEDIELVTKFIEKMS